MRTLTLSDNGLFRLVVAALAAITASSLGAGPVMANGPSTATQINPAVFAGKSRTELAATFPDLSTHELDRLVFRVAEAAATTLQPAIEVAGAWACSTDGLPTATLFIRTLEKGYLMMRKGTMSGGTYTLSSADVTVADGPLADMGMLRGALEKSAERRLLTFVSATGPSLVCREVR